MKREFLKGLEIEDAVIDKIMAEHGKTINPLKESLSKKEGELTDLQARYGEVETQLNDLQKSAGDSENLKTELDKIKGEFETYKAESTKRENNRVKLDKFKEALSTKFAPDALNLILSQANPDEIMLTEKGEIVDLESKISRMESSYPSMVLKTSNETPPPAGGSTVNDVDYSKLSDAEYYAAKREKGEIK